MSGRTYRARALDVDREWLIDRPRNGLVAVMARSWDPPTQGQWVRVNLCGSTAEAVEYVKGCRRRLAALMEVGLHAHEYAA